MRYFHFCAHEQFPPDGLLRQAVAAERAGFDGIGCSDHLQPWGEGGESGNAWVWLGDEDLREAMIISADPQEHVERIRQVEKLGAGLPAGARPQAG